MVWFESAQAAISSSNDGKNFFIAFVDDHSEMAQRLESKFLSNKISKILENHSCYKINTDSSEWKKFQITFSCDLEPQLVLISPQKKRSIIKFDGNIDLFIRKLEETIGKSVLNLNNDHDKEDDERLTEGETFKAKIKFSENDNIWITEFDKWAEFGDVRSHVAEVLNMNKSDFSLISRMPRHIFDASEDKRTLSDLSIYPSCYIHVKINNSRGESSTRQSFNVFGSIYGLFATVFSILFSYLFLNFQQASNTPENHQCTSTTVLENSAKFDKPGDNSDDDETRKTDNGNTTLLM